MGVNWKLSKVDPNSYQTVDADAFEPHPFQPEEVDLILVGSMHGPVMDAFLQRTEVSNDGSHSIDILPVEVVKTLAVRLMSIKRSDFAPMAVVLRASWHFVEKEDEEGSYEDLAAVTERLGQFTRDAADQNCAIRLEVFC